MERLRLLLTNGGKRSPWIWAGPFLGAVGTFVAAFLIMPDVPLLAKLPIALVMSAYMVGQAAMYIYRDESGPDDRRGEGGGDPVAPAPQPPVLRLRIESREVTEPAPSEPPAARRELEKTGTRR